MDVPAAAPHALAKQLLIESMQDASAYGTSEQRWLNAMELREVYGCVEFTDQRAGWKRQLTDTFIS